MSNTPDHRWVPPAPPCLGRARLERRRRPLRRQLSFQATSTLPGMHLVQSDTNSEALHPDRTAVAAPRSAARQPPRGLLQRHRPVQATDGGDQRGAERRQRRHRRPRPSTPGPARSATRTSSTPGPRATRSTALARSKSSARPPSTSTPPDTSPPSTSTPPSVTPPSTTSPPPSAPPASAEPRPIRRAITPSRKTHHHQQQTQAGPPRLLPDPRRHHRPGASQLGDRLPHHGQELGASAARNVKVCRPGPGRAGSPADDADRGRRGRTAVGPWGSWTPARAASSG